MPRSQLDRSRVPRRGAPCASSPRSTATFGSPEAALSQIASAIAGRSSAAEVSEIVAAEVRRLVPCDRSAVGLWEPEHQALRLIAVSMDGAPPGTGQAARLTLDDCALRGVLETLQPMRDADLRVHDFPFERKLGEYGLRARLVVPAVAHGKAIAILVALSRRPNVYTIRHQRLLEHLSIQLAVGLEHARLIQETRRHEERLLGLQSVAQRLASSAVNQEELLDAVLEEAVRSVGGDTGTLLMWDSEKQVLVPARNTVPTAREYTVLRPGQGVAGRAVQRRQVVILHDYQRESGNETPAGKTGVRAAIGAPLIADGNLLGAVTANTLDPTKRFDQADVQVFELLAGQAATVINTCQLFESKQRQWRAAEEAAQAAASIVSELDQQRLLELIVKRAMRLMGGAAGALSLLDRPGGDLAVRAAHSHSGQDLSRMIPPNRAISDRVLAENAFVIVHNVGAPHGDDSVSESHLHALGVPVRIRGELMGALVVLGEPGRPPYSSDDAALLQIVTDIASVAIENAGFFEKTASRAEKLTRLAQLGRLASESLDVQRVQEFIVHATTDLLSADVTRLWLVDETGESLVLSAAGGSAAGPRPGRPEGSPERLPLRGTLLGYVVASRQARYSPSLLDDPLQQNKGWVRANGFHSQLAVPLLVGKRAIGALLVAYRELRHFNRDEIELLQAFAAQVAIAIENARLFEQATKVEALAELARLKSEFISMASHELRTPAACVLGFSELLLTREPDPIEQREWIQLVHEEAARLSGLIDELLDVARIEEGRLKVTPEPLDLKTAVQHAVSVFESQSSAHRLEPCYEEPLPPVLADPTKLAQVLTNLISNAIKYSPEGGPVTISARGINGSVHLAVVDHGLGIPREELPRLFGRFHRIKDDTRQQIRGTGLGLYITKQLVELQGGRIWAESPGPGLGSTFHVDLPAVATG